MEKGSAKTIGILFIIILIVLLGAHLMAMRSVKTEFSKKELAMNQKITELTKKIETISEEKHGIEIKLELQGIRMEVAESNFGNAKDKLTAFKNFLNKSGCKKLAELTPVFDEIETSLLKKKDFEVKEGLNKVEAIIFGTKEDVQTPEKEEEAAK